MKMLVLLQQGPGYGEHVSDRHMNWDGGSWMWMWGLLMMIIVAVLVVWLVRSAIIAGHQTPGTGNSPIGGERDATGRAREILAERYAQGDITTDEYRERLDHLQ